MVMMKMILHEIAGLLLKREKIEIAGLGNMITICSIPFKIHFSLF